MDCDIEVFEIKGKLNKEEGSSFSTAFTGRSMELAELVEMAIAAKDLKKFHSYTIFGEAGIGKSRLIYEV
jgi:chromosomal replication initiation ATPase DnaA